MVEQWLEKVRADAAAHKAQRQSLMDELQAWPWPMRKDPTGKPWRATCSNLKTAGAMPAT
jgi:hypothetical protein